MTKLILTFIYENGSRSDVVLSDRSMRRFSEDRAKWIDAWWTRVQNRPPHLTKVKELRVQEYQAIGKEVRIARQAT